MAMDVVAFNAEVDRMASIIYADRVGEYVVFGNIIPLGPCPGPGYIIVATGRRQIRGRVGSTGKVVDVYRVREFRWEWRGPVGA